MTAMESTRMQKVDIFKKKFSILQDLSNAIATSHNIHEIVNLLLDCAIMYANAEKGSLMLVTDISKSAPVLSILLIKQIKGR